MHACTQLVLLQLTEDSLIRNSCIYILRKTQLRLMFKDSVLLVACVLSWIKLMHAVKDLILEDCIVLEEIIHLVTGESSTSNNARK